MQNHVKPIKSLGQNFLTATSVLDTIIETADLQGDETVVEVGGGTGVLTRALARKLQITNNKLQIDSESNRKEVKSCGKILVIEFDYRLVERLRREFNNSKVVKIIHHDALTFDWEGLPTGYAVVANIPYQITSPLINLWTTRLTNQPASMTLMVQKEVAERLTAQPGSSDRGLTTILVELYGTAHYIQTVPAKAFSPVPKVESAIIKFSKGERGDVKEKNGVIRIAKAGFSSKRRTLENSLSGSLRLPKPTVRAILKQADISAQLRAEDLSIQNWIRLTEILQCQIQKNQ